MPCTRRHSRPEVEDGAMASLVNLLLGGAAAVAIVLAGWLLVGVLGGGHLHR